MKKIYFMLATLLYSFTNIANAAEESSAFADAFAKISKTMLDVVFYELQIADGVRVKLVIVWLIVASVWFTVYMGFINIRGFKHAVELIQGKYINPDKSKAKGAGEVTPFQALTAALSGTVGIGAIGGTAIAIGIGGMGAIFWIFMAGFFGMTMKFMECTLGVKYRNEYADGKVSGGPMYYISKGFAEYGPFMGKTGKVLGWLYAVGIAIGALSIGNMFQSNQAYKQLNQVYTLMTDAPMTNGVANDGNLNAWLVGGIFAVIVFAVIVGGIKSIVKVTEKVVPIMAGLFLAFAIIVIFYNIKHIPATFAEIFAGVFTAKGVAGGVVGCIMIAFQRAIFSNEAGIGSASVAHSAVKTEHPPTEGFVALLEPFFGTIIILFISALVIGTSQIADPEIRHTLDLVRDNAYSLLNDPEYVKGSNGAGDIKGIVIASNSFQRVFSWFPYPLAIAACLFAFSTMIAWAYYGLKGWTYVFGESKVSDLTYKALYCVFIAVGAASPLSSVLDFGDAMTYFICVPNIIAIYLLGPKVKKEVNIYFAKIKSGEIKKYS